MTGDYGADLGRTCQRASRALGSRERLNLAAGAAGDFDGVFYRRADAGRSGQERGGTGRPGGRR